MLDMQIQRRGHEKYLRSWVSLSTGMGKDSKARSELCADKFIYRSKTVPMSSTCRRVLSHVQSTALNGSIKWPWSAAMIDKVRAWEAQILRLTFRPCMKPDENWVGHTKRNAQSLRKSWRKMGLLLLTEKIASKIWTTMTWAVYECDVPIPEGRIQMRPIIAKLTGGDVHAFARDLLQLVLYKNLLLLGLVELLHGLVCYRELHVTILGLVRHFLHSLLKDLVLLCQNVQGLHGLLVKVMDLSVYLGVLFVRGA